ncbi:flavodoxin-dependent (E)-4-hydroxy-3-methylbut-2-enyl-diphosphate synthase [bacterium]|nr:flavodoxin-dependent (E)-4-hydroxy-3-methylbut-2-enyl-diphosphate synthase [bacterium]
MNRKKTIKFKIGNKEIGGDSRILIQSMSTHLPSDKDACIKECLELENAGCDIVRVAIKTKEDAMMIKDIKKAVNVPIVADIHFNYELGIIAIENGVDKIRFNPGNIGSDDKLKALIDKCIEYDIPVRIGVNSGSIEKDIDKLEISNVKKCVLSLERYIEKVKILGLKKIVLSVKLSNVLDTIEAYREISKLYDYPLHIGLTESGVGDDAIIKSSIALGTLIEDGIGDTLRVSLTGNPVREVYAAKGILKSLGLLDSPDLISCPTCGRTEVDLEKYAKEIDTFLKTVDKKITVAVMGCLVNGPGEAKDADMGVAFISKQGVLFKKGVVVFKGTPDEAIEKLKKEIINF